MTDTSAAPSPTGQPRAAWGIGIATFVDQPGDRTPVGGGDQPTSSQAKVLDTWYPEPILGITEAALRLSEAVGCRLGTATHELSAQHGADALGVDVAHLTGPDERRGVRRAVVVTFVEDLDAPPVDAHDAYLRLHLLSHRRVQPRGLSVEGIFTVLNNVVWTNHGPCPVEGFEATRMRLKAAGQVVTVHGVDKFPPMVDYVAPAGVRVAVADRVRLGAHLAAGTTVMHEGYCNFNAGTLGAAMVEGRISAGVVVGDGSDIGGGASIMGTLSGGGKEVISIGSGCLVGANAGVGISLGDRCTIQAGLYVLAGTRVTTPDGQVVKAVELSGRSDLLFRQNSVSGTVEVLSQSVDWGSLNADLHHNG